MTHKFPIFDGHNDTLLDLYAPERGENRSFFERSVVGHIDLPRAQDGGLAGGFFAIFAPNPPDEQTMTPDKYPGAGAEESDAFTYAIPLPRPLTRDHATAQVNGMIRLLYQIEAESLGAAKIARSGDEIATCIGAGVLAMLMHFEGAEAIDPGLDALHVYYAAGLRSLGIVWSRPNAFGHGVPFIYPGAPDIGPGLTDAGKALVRECNQLGVMVDLAHLNEAGFWDVAAITDAPLVATHSNAHALCPCPRNLTDKQLDALAESGGVVGLNYHIAFLRADGKLVPETSLSEIVRHARYIADRIGVDHLALGSDFDGATVPADLKDAAGLPKLVAALRAAGFSEDELAKIAHGNWVRVLKTTWG